MPANKSNLSTPRKEKSSNGLVVASAAAAASKKKKRSTCVKHKKHCKQYLVSVSRRVKNTAKQAAILTGKGTRVPMTRRASRRFIKYQRSMYSDRSFREPSWRDSSLKCTVFSTAFCSAKHRIEMLPSSRMPKVRDAPRGISSPSVIDPERT